MGSGMPVVLIGDPQGRFTRDQKVYGTGPAAPPSCIPFRLQTQEPRQEAEEQMFSLKSIQCAENKWVSRVGCASAAYLNDQIRVICSQRTVDIQARMRAILFKTNIPKLLSAGGWHALFFNFVTPSPVRRQLRVWRRLPDTSFRVSSENSPASRVSCIRTCCSRSRFSAYT